MTTFTICHYLLGPWDRETLCSIPQKWLSASQITDDALRVTCEECCDLQDEIWQESMRSVFGSAAGMTSEEFETMGFIWDIEDEVE